MQSALHILMFNGLIICLGDFRVNVTCNKSNLSFHASIPIEVVHRELLFRATVLKRDPFTPKAFRNNCAPISHLLLDASENASPLPTKAHKVSQYSNTSPRFAASTPLKGRKTTPVEHDLGCFTTPHVSIPHVTLGQRREGFCRTFTSKVLLLAPKRTGIPEQATRLQRWITVSRARSHIRAFIMLTFFFNGHASTNKVILNLPAA